MKRLLSRFVPLALLLGCQAQPITPGPSPSPQVSPTPQMTPSPSPSPQTGSRPTLTPGPEYALASSDSSQAFGTEWKDRCSLGFQTTTAYLGGLSPKLPLAICTRSGGERGTPANPDWIKPHTSFFLGVVQTVYLLKEGDTVKELETLTQVKNTFAPIETSEEALSYLFATTARVDLLNAKNLPEAAGPESFSGARYKVQSLEGTRVEKQGEDFLVKNMLQNGTCLADGRDILAYSTDYLIRRSGEIERGKQTEIYTFGPCPIE